MAILPAFGAPLSPFLIIAGLDLNSDPPQPFKLGVWPWVLLALGVIAAAAIAIHNGHGLGIVAVKASWEAGVGVGAGGILGDVAHGVHAVSLC